MEPQGDAYNQVALGQAGTGGAVIFDQPKRDPLQIALNFKKEEQQLGALAAKAKKDEDAAKRKEYEALLITPEFGLESDREFLTKQFQNIHGMVADSYAGGEDILNPFSKNRSTYNQAATAAKGLAAKSSEQNKQYQAALTSYRNDRSKFMPDYPEKLATWYSTPLEQRGPIPSPDEYVDKAAAVKKLLDNVGAASISASARNENGQIREGTFETRDRDDAIQGAISGSQDYHWQEEAKNWYDGLDEVQQQVEQKKVRAINDDRATRGLPEIDLTTAYLYDNYTNRSQYTKATQNLQDRSAAGLGYDDNVKAAEELNQKLRALGTGNYPGMQWEKAPILQPDGTYKLAPGGDKLADENIATSSALSGYKFGNTRLKPVQVAYKGADQKLSIRLVPDETVTAEKPLTQLEAELMQNMAGKWFDVDDLATELGAPIVEGNKEYTMGTWLKNLADHDAFPVDAKAKIYEKFPGGQKQTGPPGTGGKKAIPGF